MTRRRIWRAVGLTALFLSLLGCGDDNTGSTKNAPITDNNDIWGEATDSARNKDAVDAQYGAQTTYDFFKDVLGRDSIDGQGEKLISDVHVGTNFANAFWDVETMNYGDVGLSKPV